MKKRKIITFCCAAIMGLMSLQNVSAYSTINKDFNKDMNVIPQNYKITYDLKGGSFGNIQAPTSYNGFTNTFKIPTPTKSGYTFAGWREEQDKLTSNLKWASHLDWADIQGDRFILHNKDSNNIYYNFKLQTWKMDSYGTLTYLDGFSNTTDIRRHKGIYEFKHPTGYYQIAVASNGSTEDIKLAYEVYLEQGQIYDYEYNLEKCTKDEIIISDLKFYKKGHNKVNIPCDIITKKSYGDRKYTAIWK